MKSGAGFKVEGPRIRVMKKKRQDEKLRMWPVGGRRVRGDFSRVGDRGLGFRILGF